jgi:hypothetical protein
MRSAATRRKIGDALRRQVPFNCDNCGAPSSDKPSQYRRRKRHFCARACYSAYRRDKLPKEEQPRFGSGFDETERAKRRKARSTLNHHLRDTGQMRQPCEVCGSPAEAHHDDYDKPLDVRWLCFEHHRAHHAALLNPELLERSTE